MTEAKWLACKSPGDMLDYLCAQCGISRRKGGSRKLRLLACACCRRVSHMLTEIRDRRVVVLSEDFADGRVSAEKLEAARRRCLDRALHLFPEVRAAVATAGPRPRAAAGEVMASVCDALASQDADYDARWRAEAGALAEVVREVFGNPFRPASAIVRAWLAWDGGTVPNLAAAVYEERAFDRLPVLADALEEAGCADAAILDHCRGPGSHVRGCWVVDLVLGKE